MKKKVEKSNPIIAYKGFNENLCSSYFGFQYEVGKEYHINGDVEMCENGFHACQNPLDVFEYYNMSQYTRYAMVELWGDVDFANVGKKICASNIRIVKEIGIDEMVTLGIMASMTKIKVNENDKISNDMIISCKNDDRIYNPHNFGRVASRGSNTSILSIGHWQKIASIGDNANICISSTHGYVNSCGSNARIMSLEDKSTIESTGEKALVISAGNYTKAKAKVGSWIVLTEYDNNKNIKCVKAEYVDGERIKGDTLYMLFDGEFVKVI